MDEIDAVFEELEDPRTGNAKRHALHEILLIALCTVLCGGETCADMALFARSKRAFLEEFLTLEHGIPSHDTFSRVFRLLDPDRFHAWFISFMKGFAEACRGVIAIDGKTLRRSFDRAAARSPLHMVSAWAADQRLVLAQIAVDDKSNEIVAVPKLLELLSLARRILTADAISCQRKLAEQVIERKGDYVLALKSNQGTLHDDVRRFLDDPETPLMRAGDTDKGHGRIEDPHGQPKRRHRLAAGVSSLAGPQGRRQGQRHPRDQRQDHPGNPLLSAQPSVHPGALQRHRAQPLEHREPASLGARRDHGRGSGQEP